jgi:hypothetical protein
MGMYLAIALCRMTLRMPWALLKRFTQPGS